MLVSEQFINKKTRKSSSSSGNRIPGNFYFISKKSFEKGKGLDSKSVSLWRKTKMPYISYSWF